MTDSQHALEDSVYLSKGVLAPSNAAMVEKVRRMVEEFGAQIASPAQARTMLGLPAREAA